MPLRPRPRGPPSRRSFSLEEGYLAGLVILGTLLALLSRPALGFVRVRGASRFGTVSRDRATKRNRKR